jgi:hypothetical protein
MTAGIRGWRSNNSHAADGEARPLIPSVARTD